ncbi:MAG: ATP-binding protein [Thermoanaerobaculia bacterium]
MGTSLAVLVLTCVAFVSYEYLIFRKNIVVGLRTRGEIIAANSSAALAFQNEPDAREVLSALRIDPHMVAACLYDRTGAVFAKYPPDLPASSIPPSPGPDGSRFAEGAVAVVLPITEDSRRLGTVYLRSDLVALTDRLRLYAALVAAVIAASLSVAFALSTRLQGRISAPILDLARTAQTISERRDYSLRARKTSDDEIGRLTDSFNDMLEQIQTRDTALRKTQDEVQTLNSELERRVEDRTAQLETANKELASFSYSVSHDLRAPLRAIDGFSQALLDEAGDRLDDNGRRDLERVRAGAQRMAQLIDDLLSLSHVSRQSLDRRPVDLSGIAAETFASLARTEPDRTVAFELARQVTAEADEGLIRLLLQNLIGNAWKFTARRDAGKIEFGARIENGQTQYFIRDNGAGFDMAYAHKLFGAFQRLHAAGEFEGTGIGLATVARIVHRHGGEVGAEGRLNQGATFWFTLERTERS